MLVDKSFLYGMRKGEELKAPSHASAAATRDGNLLSHDGSLPYVTATCLIPDNKYLNKLYNYSTYCTNRVLTRSVHQPLAYSSGALLKH